MTAKILGVFGVGAALGSLITYFAVKDKFAQATEEAVESVRQMYKEKYEPEKEEAEKEKVQISTGDAEFYKPEVTTKDRKEYEKLVGKYWKDHAVRDKAEEESPKEMADINPYIISGEQFAREMPYYGKITCTFYAGDGQLIAEETSDVPAIYSREGDVLDIEYNIGADVLNAFEDIDDLEEGILYVRNDNIGMDFEIYYDEGCFEVGDSPGGN